MIQFAQILFILSVLVILHEFGHYITAKIFKVRVEKFYLFMDSGFSLFKKKIGKTEWGIGWLPIGGYVKLSGMIDESLDKDQMKEDPQPWEFRSKPAWQRLIIMLGGIFVNLVLAWFIYFMIFSTVGQKFIATEAIQHNGLAFGSVGESVGFVDGDKVISVDGKLQPKFKWLIVDMLLSDEIKINRNGETKTINLTEEQKRDILQREGKTFVYARTSNYAVDSIVPQSNAFKAGLQLNDQFIAVNGKKVTYYDELIDQLKANQNDSIKLDILRGEKTVRLNGLVDNNGKFGFSITPIGSPNYLKVNKLSFGEAIPAGFNEAWQLFIYNIKQFKLILSPKTEAYKQVKSPIGIARDLPDTWNWEFIWNFTALFSIGLAFMNLLPIPGLDGGHALFTIAEMISGKKPSDKAMEYIQTGGMIFLLSLMALVFGKDIYQWIIDSI